ncbi:hypothetical protein AB205_0163790 [Aquarana catesbeiana]|uniref:Uncharacterized protein n=1 Tax=Aquarana catesbeiana TaxID=8400 RepID=A0A2G9SF72_AQUCT|nr:hypothetical protein AB205_0163790 [Aquarana catesbeiana]
MPELRVNGFQKLAIAKNNIIKLQEENHQIRNDNAMIFMKAHQHLEESDTDLESARVQHEIELAVKLLEKDILEKQDTLIGLKEQLEEVKAINFEMYQKMQCSEEEAKKRDVNDGQDGKSTQMSACRKPYEERLSSEVWIWYSKCQAEDDHARKLQLKRQISSSDVES